ncbi:DUF4440 domain-containing protein [Sporosarcina jiandibaonis]|uniref:DUF4440 domain-containing protein n=1 Tax=Sporosarcina jiandibaonis TaxID=2715535 RepID=UPI001551D39D|nr:DUF4440 domain-containing protein [Sporosarcina jiandibaonis]
MNIEVEVATQVYRMRALHEGFSAGEFEEMNALYSKDFQGWLFMPSTGKVELYNAEQIREGNKGAAQYYRNKDIKFTHSGLTIVPQMENQVAVSYEITHENENKIVRALSLEVWKKESDGQLRMIRWYEEKGEIL